MSAREAAQSPCAACPWRIENHGKRHPSGWYRKSNRRFLWARLRRGENMSCHPTDPRNPVTEADQAAGYRAAPDHAEVRECAGAIILQQREVHIFSWLADRNRTKEYDRRGGVRMTLEGLLAVAGRAMVTWPGDVPMRRDHDLDEPVGLGDGQLEWDGAQWL